MSESCNKYYFKKALQLDGSQVEDIESEQEVYRNQRYWNQKRKHPHSRVYYVNNAELAQPQSPEGLSWVAPMLSAVSIDTRQSEEASQPSEEAASWEASALVSVK